MIEHGNVTDVLDLKLRQFSPPRRGHVLQRAQPRSSTSRKNEAEVVEILFPYRYSGFGKESQWRKEGILAHNEAGLSLAALRAWVLKLYWLYYGDWSVACLPCNLPLTPLLFAFNPHRLPMRLHIKVQDILSHQLSLSCLPLQFAES
jgi:hypothetical protein